MKKVKLSRYYFKEDVLQPDIQFSNTVLLNIN
jgi:hypothetical protein